ncbi:MAG TPA: heme o synthase [Candidatus Saccharimonadales bacterium]|nr:heme o synthase [Candidatus Saccharimonadales bacterium]
MHLLRTYYRLTKPGIIYGNSLNIIAGFLLASGIVRHFDFWLLVATLVGSAFVIGAGCVYNNYIDRDIDTKMARTKKRGLATHSIPVAAALAFGTVLLTAGFATLALWTNTLTVVVGVTGFLFYVVMYSIFKRTSVYGTLVGSVSGAIPPVAGYTAVTNSLDSGAWILFVILVAWQMPHFYAIAMYRFHDYKNAGLPVWPVKKGMHSTKVQIAIWIALFTIAAALMTLQGYTGDIYLVGVLILGALWFKKALQGFRAEDDAKWARGMFFFSLVVTVGIDALLAVGALLP